MPLSAQQILEKMPALAAHFKVIAAMRAQRERVNVLVVEDQLFSRRILEEVLREKHNIECAETAKEGVKLFLEHAPDIVLLDIMLPDESGHMLAKVMKSIDATTYIVMVTANNSIEDVTMAKSNKVDGFIVKPYNKAKIIECIEKYYVAHPERQPKGKQP